MNNFSISVFDGNDVNENYVNINNDKYITCTSDKNDKNILALKYTRYIVKCLYLRHSNCDISFLNSKTIQFINKQGAMHIKNIVPKIKYESNNIKK